MYDYNITTQRNPMLCRTLIWNMVVSTKRSDCCRLIAMIAQLKYTVASRGDAPSRFNRNLDGLGAPEALTRQRVCRTQYKCKIPSIHALVSIWRQQ